MATSSVILATLAILICVQSQSIQSDPEMKIIGGKVAVPHSAPFIVNLISEGWDHSKGQYIQYVCGGSIISREYILTAAHCVQDMDNVKVTYGAHNLSRQEPNEISVYSFSFNKHPWADIALIRVYPPVNFNDHIQSIEIPPESDKTNYTSRRAKAYGWGLISDSKIFPGVLMEADLRLVDLARCNEELGPHSKHASEGELCTTGHGIKGTCGGDSGGPLVLDGVLIGITSWGPRKCEAGDPSVYVRVRDHAKWIAENAQLT